MLKRKKTAIIGAGRGGTAFLQMLSDYRPLEIVGIADITEKAPGIQLAKKLGITVYQDYMDFFEINDLELIINLTGDLKIDSIVNEYMARNRGGIKGPDGKRGSNLEILGGMSAKLVWEIVNSARKKEEEKSKLANYLSDLNKELYSIKEYSENVVENSADAIITTNLEKKIVSFNKGAENMLGYTREEIIGNNATFFWKNQEEREYLLKELENKGHISNYEAELVTKSNHTIQVSLTLSRLKNQEGKVIGTVGISKDISEGKKMEKELLRSNQELEDFVYTISHDLQAPLRAIFGFSDLLIEENKDKLDEDATHYLGRIKKGTERMKQLIDDLLELSRIGHQEKSFKKIDTGEIVATVKDFFHFDIKNRNGEIKFATDFPSIKCDKTRIQQVFSNLISNAVKFCDNSPVIEVGYLEKEKAHEFYVKDNGIGITTDYHKKIFQIFQRLNNAEKYEGTGIGLTIVKKIIEIHNGEIRVESTPKQGTTFFFTIDKYLE